MIDEQREKIEQQLKISAGKYGVDLLNKGVKKTSNNALAGTLASAKTGAVETSKQVGYAGIDFAKKKVHSDKYAGLDNAYKAVAAGVDYPTINTMLRQKYNLPGDAINYKNKLTDEEYEMAVSAFNRSRLKIEDLAHWQSMVEQRDSELLDINNERQKNVAKSQARMQAVDDKYKLGKVGEVAQDIGSVGGALIPTLAAGVIGGLVGGPAGAGAAANAMIGLQSAGLGYNQALDEGASQAQAESYGALSGLKEIGVNKVTGGLSKSLGKGIILNSLENTTKKNVAKNIAKDFGGEAIEGGLSAATDPFLQRATYNEDAENLSAKEIAYNALLEGAVGGVFGVPSNVLDYRVNKHAAQKAQNGVQSTENEDAINYSSEENGGLNGKLNTIEPYSLDEIKKFQSAKITIANEETDLNRFAANALKEERGSAKVKLFLGKISNSLGEKIKSKTGIDLTGYNVSISNHEIRKIILNSHGNEIKENLRGQRAVTEDDIAKIYDIVKAPDNIYTSGETKQGKPVITFEKQIGDLYFYVQYVSDKHKTLDGQTMYIRRKKSPYTGEDNQNDSLVNTSETTSDKAFNGNIAQNDNVVNDAYKTKKTEDQVPTDTTVSAMRHARSGLDPSVNNSILQNSENVNSAYKTKKQTPAVTNAAEAPQFNVRNERQEKSASNITIAQGNVDVNENQINKESQLTPKKEKEIKTFIDLALNRIDLRKVYENAGNRYNMYIQGDTIHINKDKIDRYDIPTIKRILAHDIYHSIESTEEGRRIADIALKFAGPDAINRKIAEYAENGITLDEAGARAEIGADFIEKAMTDEATINRILLEDRTLAQRILTFIKDMIAILNAKRHRTKEEAGELVALIRARRLYEDALAKVRKGEYEAGFYGKDGEIREHAIKQTANGEKYVELTQNIVSQKPATMKKEDFIKNYLVNLAKNNPDVFARIEENGHKIYLDKDVLPREYVYSPAAQNAKGETKTVREMALTNLDEIIEISNNKKFEGNRKEKSQPKMADKKRGGIYKYDVKLLVPFKNEGKSFYTANVIVRYDQDGKRYLYDIVNIKKDNSPTTYTPSNDSYRMNEGVLSNTNILNSNQNVKRSNIKNYDSNGNKLSAAQQEYFKNSKVRDDDGNLMPMYHGSQNAGFKDVYNKNPTKDKDIRYNAKDYTEEDQAYMDAVNRGDMETAQRMVDEAARKAGYSANDNYRGGHYAPVAQIEKEDFTNLDKLRELQEESFDLNLFAIANGLSLQPKDYFSPNGARWYMYDDYEGMESYGALKKAINSIQNQMQQYGEVKNMPTVKVYRAVPKAVKESKMQSGGQWVSPSKQYAIKHGKSHINGDYKIIEEEVSAENLWWDANDIREWGFDDGENYAYRNTKNNRKLLDAVTYDDDGNIIPLSKRFKYRNPDVRYNTTRYDELVEEYGAMDKGMETRVDIDVPQQTSDFDKTRRFTRTALEAETVDEDTKGRIIDDLAGDISSGRFTYTPESNESLQERANGRIAKQGFDGAKETVLNKFKNDDKITAEDIATAEQLIVLASDKGDVDSAYDLIGMLAIIGTEQGKSIQALSMLKRMTPEGRLRQMQGLANRISSQYGLVGNQEIVVPKKLARKLLNQKTAEGMDDVQAEIIQKIAEQTPVTFMDKLDAWRYLSMLGNVRTHMRNVLGNGMHLALRRIKDQMAGIMENSVLKEGGRTKAVGFTKKEYRDWAKKNFAEEGKRLLASSSKYSDMTEVEMAKRIFGKTDRNVLEKVRKFNTDMMEAEDMLFKKGEYVYALARYMQANKLTPKMLESDEKLRLKAQEYAVQEAKIATFQEANAVASALSRFENKRNAKGSAKVAQIGLKAVMPFKRTPINILKRGFEYSPAGLVKAISYDAKKVKSGEMTANEMIDHLSMGLTGSGIVVLGYYLASLGLLSLGYDRENARKENYEGQLGEQNYALTLPNGGTFTIDWAAPAVMPLFVGASLYEELTSENEETSFLNALIRTSVNVVDPIMEMSMMEGLQSALSSYASGTESITDYGANLATGYASQFIPTLFGQIARSIDDVKRSSYAPSNSQFTQTGEEFARQSINKLPLVSKLSEPNVDVWGRERKQEGDGVLERVAYNMLLPGAYASNKETALDKEIRRLYEELGENSIIPKSVGKYVELGGKRYTLSSKDYAEQQKYVGSRNFGELSVLVKSTAYKNMNDDERAAAIADVYEYNNYLGKQRYLKSKGIAFENTTMENKKKNLESCGSWSNYFRVKNGIADVKESNSSIVSTNQKSAANKKAVAKLLSETSGLTNAQRQQIWASMGGYDGKDTYQKIARQYGFWR